MVKWVYHKPYIFQFQIFDTNWPSLLYSIVSYACSIIFYCLLSSSCSVIFYCTDMYIVIFLQYNILLRMYSVIFLQYDILLFMNCVIFLQCNIFTVHMCILSFYWSTRWHIATYLCIFSYTYITKFYSSHKYDISPSPSKVGNIK